MAAQPLTAFQQILTWVGFEGNALQSLETELGDLVQLSELKPKDIKDLSQSYSRRTVADGRIHFGLNRTKRLLAVIDWVADQHRIGEQPDINGLDQESFLETINESADRAEIRKNEVDTMETRAKSAEPGKLTGDSDWEQWHEKLCNMLSIYIGVHGVPLSYVIRENEEPDEDEEFDTFMEECVAKCPLEGPKFEADARTVHQFITSYTTGTNSEQWVKPKRKQNNGRVDLIALRNHYRGEGNRTRRIADAEKLRDTLHYKSETAMPFETFLSKVQKMFNLFEDAGEPMQEAAKVRFLFDKIQNADLTMAIKSLKSTAEIVDTAISFTKAANHLAAEITPKPTRGLSAVTTDGGSKAAIMKDGKINTGYYSNWGSLSSENKKAVIDERKRLGINKKKGGDGAKKNLKSLNAQVKSLAKTVKKQKNKIAAIKRSKNDNDSSSDSGSSDSDEEPTNNAGNAFGGRQEKTKKKQRKKSKS